jgi:hypothetical protein
MNFQGQSSWNQSSQPRMLLLVTSNIDSHTTLTLASSGTASAGGSIFLPGLPPSTPNHFSTLAVAQQMDS